MRPKFRTVQSSSMRQVHSISVGGMDWLDDFEFEKSFIYAGHDERKLPTDNVFRCNGPKGIEQSGAFLRFYDASKKLLLVYKMA